MKQLYKKLKRIYCTSFFERTIYSPVLIYEHFKDEIYGAVTGRSSLKLMLKFKEDKKCPGIKLIFIILETSSADNGTTATMIPFWQKMLMV